MSTDIQVSVRMIYVEYRFFFESHKKSGWISRTGNSRVAGKLKVGTFKINRLGIRKPGGT